MFQFEALRAISWILNIMGASMVRQRYGMPCFWQSLVISVRRETQRAEFAAEIRLLSIVHRLVLFSHLDQDRPESNPREQHFMDQIIR